MQWHISSACPADAAMLSELHGAVFQRKWAEEELCALLQATGVVGRVAAPQRSGAPAGFILTRAAGAEAEILSLAVEKQHRQRGCATALLNDVLKGLAEAGLKALFMEVARDNEAARALYGAMGFFEAGVRKDYYGSATGARADAIILRHDFGAA